MSMVLFTVMTTCPIPNGKALHRFPNTSTLEISRRFTTVH